MTMFRRDPLDRAELLDGMFKRLKARQRAARVNRDSHIVKASRAGYTVDEIAERLGLTTFRVILIIERAGERKA